MTTFIKAKLRIYQMDKQTLANIEWLHMKYYRISYQSNILFIIMSLRSCNIKYFIKTLILISKIIVIGKSFHVIGVHKKLHA